MKRIIDKADIIGDNKLFDEISHLIDSARTRVAQYADSSLVTFTGIYETELTRMF